MKSVRRVALGRYELIAFVIGFCLLAYELVAARLLAPYIGSSIYVWTSVIGVIILALSLGYAFGGWLADKRVKPSDVAYLLLIAAGGVTVTLAAYAAVLAAIIIVIADPRLQGLFASLVLFAPTSFILGSISPYLARLKLKSITTTGRTVARLSAINSLGGITGTLVTGFILLGFFGANQILIMLIVSLIILSWTVTPRRAASERAVITIGIVSATLFFLRPSLPLAVLADIDTPSSHYQIRQTSGELGPYRALITGPGAMQSGALTSGSSQLVFWYTRQIADVVRQAPKRDNILILGGGAFSLPRYFSQKYPDAHITVVEIDPELPRIAKDYFYYQPAENISVVSEDARSFLEKNNQTYDVVVVDAFGDTSVPFTLTTKEYAAALGRATGQKGVVAANFIVSTAGACGQLFGGIDASYKSSFGRAVYFAKYPDHLDLRQNFIAVYTRQPAAWLDQARAVTITPPESDGFSDNFTPSDRLNFECRLQNPI